MKTHSNPSPKSPIQIEAQRLVASGLSIITVKADGSKAPALASWKRYQSTPPTAQTVSKWLSNGDRGIAVVCGPVSGNLEVLDFDEPPAFESWRQLVKDLGGADLLKKLVIVKTPNGVHVYYRCPDGIEGNQKLAQQKGKNGSPKVVIETRGRGGYVIAPGSPAGCHSSGRLYELQAGELTEISDITGAERELLFEAAYAQNAFVEPDRIVGRSKHNEGNRPGDEFNRRGSWDEVPLEAKGWKIVGKKNEMVYLQRPGKEKGISATLNFGGSDILYNFSSNGHPFKATTSYTKFGALAYLEYGCDFPATASHLAKQGYGEKFTSEHPYHAVPSGLYYTKSTNDGPMSVFLTNFTARIVADVTEDDGVETRHSYEIEAKLKGRSYRFTVPSAQFGGLRWVPENLGAQAIVHPYVGRERTPVAIQFLSEDGMLQKIVYTHTGWLKVDDQYVYLHAGGALGQDGPVSGIEVQLDGGLSRYRLTEPGDDLVESIEASLRFLDVAPDTVTVPLFCGIWRAVLGEIDCSNHLVGQTGKGKSELAALCVQHFGSEMKRTNLPANWSSTDNALEDIAFRAKDALLVIDDFNPTGTPYDMRRTHAKADRVLRAQGNRSGRQRLRSDTSVRPTRPPRGFILSTGEAVPKGHSLKARLWVSELAPDDVDWIKLTACQEDAAKGVYAQTLAGFIQWLAPQYETVRRNLSQEIRELRKAASGDDMHKRTPDIVANFAIGLRLFLDFAEDTGAITAESRRELWDRGWSALGEGAATQQQQQASDEPTQQLLAMLRAAIATGKAHVAGQDGYEPSEHSRAWGWREGFNEDSIPRGNCVGWIHGEDLYLEPTAAYAVAQSMATASGGGLAVGANTLKKRLKERNLLRSTDNNRTTIRKMLGGSRQSVLHLHRDALAQFEAQ